MKSFEEVISIIRELKNEAEQKYKVEIVGIFGSFARGEQKETSDVDVLVKFCENATLFDFIGLSDFLQEKLGINVDVVPVDAVREELRERINQDMVMI